MTTRILLLLGVFVLLGTSAPAGRIPILLDTDIGGDIDDALALALALEHPDIDLRGVTTVHEDAYTRAPHCLSLAQRVGPTGDSRRCRFGASYYAGLPRADAVRASSLQSQTTGEDARRRVSLSADREAPGELTIVAVGPLTNIAKLLTQHPDSAKKIKRLIVMGGAVRVGYTGKAPVVAEYNVRSDIDAAQKVFRSGVPLVVAPLDASATLELDADARSRIFQSNTTSTNQLLGLYQLWQKSTPILFDPVALALAIDAKGFTMQDLHLDVDAKGFTRPGKGKPNCRVAVAGEGARFVNWYVEQVAEKPKNPRPFRVLNPTRPVERGGLPSQVHVVEDYETDIEHRWWLAGLPETKTLPTASTRACRSVLCDDFDGKMGDPKAMYQAVIFNPVPGPPMGTKTRLSFRCRLAGTDKLRVQIYSLSNATTAV